MVDGVEYAVGNTNNDIDEQDKSTDSIPSPLFLGTKPKKRLTSKVWNDFIPSFVDGKLAHAECMHCHRIFNCCGTSSLWNHQAKCSPGIQIQKRQKLQQHTSLPSIQKSTAAANLDPKQKKLPFQLSSLGKGTGIADAMAEQDLALPDTPTDTNRKNQEAIQNGSHEEPGAPEQKNLALPVISTDQNKKNQGAEQNISYEELVMKLAMDGHATSMVEQDNFWKLVAHLNPVVKIPSRIDMIRKTFDLFEQEKIKLKEKLTALPCRVCLSAYVWHYDPLRAFLCLTVHYVDDEWKKQKKIIEFSHVYPSRSSSAESLSYTISRAIGEWGLDDKVFSIILDDAFIDDSVASNVKTNLQKRNKVAANRSLFVARYATHLLDEVIQVGLDELDTTMDNSKKCSRMYPTPSSAHHPKHRYASVDAWTKAQKISKYLQEFHTHKDLVHKFPTPDYLFDRVWDVKEKVIRNCDVDRYKTHWEVHLREKEEEGISTMRLNMEKKFNKCWKVCFFHFCMPMVMDPKHRLEHIKSRIQPFTVPSMYTMDSDVEDYIGEVHDTLLNLYGEYSNQDQPDCTWSKIWMGEFIGRDILHELYLHSKYPYGQRPLSELNDYLQEAQLPTGKFSVLEWWKEHSLTYPSLGRMARDILALPSGTDCKAAIRTARLAMSESAYGSGVEKLVCIQDWLAPAGTASVESTVN